MPQLHSQNKLKGARRRAGAPSAAGAFVGGEAVARAGYDFAIQGGAVGTIPLLGSTLIPSGAIITRVVINTITPLTSGGSATVALRTEAAADLLAATAIGSAPWVAAGPNTGKPNAKDGSFVLTTAARDVSFVIATAALTAGKADIYVFYIPPAD